MLSLSAVHGIMNKKGEVMSDDSIRNNAIHMHSRLRNAAGMVGGGEEDLLHEAADIINSLVPYVHTHEDSTEEEEYDVHKEVLTTLKENMEINTLVCTCLVDECERNTRRHTQEMNTQNDKVQLLKGIKRILGMLFPMMILCTGLICIWCRSY